MRQISRAEAEYLINDHWKTAAEECRKVNAPIPRCSFETARNYEIEDRLLEVFGEKFVVNEWCPFNGMFCSWSDHCEISDLSALSEKYKGKTVVHGLSAPYMLTIIENIIAKRKQRDDTE